MEGIVHSKQKGKSMKQTLIVTPGAADAVEEILSSLGKRVQRKGNAFQINTNGRGGWPLTPADIPSPFAVVTEGATPIEMGEFVLTLLSWVCEMISVAEEEKVCQTCGTELEMFKGVSKNGGHHPTYVYKCPNGHGADVLKRSFGLDASNFEWHPV